MREIKINLEDIALRVVTLEPDDIPALGEILNLLTILEKKAKEKELSLFIEVTGGIKAYIEKFIFGEESDPEPLDDGITVLQEMCRCFDNNEPYEGDIRPILERLGIVSNAVNTCENAQPPVEPTHTDEKSGAETEKFVDAESTQAEELSLEDIQIISDFIVESQENLESIEINLVELEQDPGDREIINAIFRPFHTIKGVSGFLNFQKINRLAHTTENLLDSARQGEFVIDDKITDIILESVDTLKKLILGVERNLASGGINLEADIDVESLIERIEAINSATTYDGNKPLGKILVEKGLVTEEDVEKGLQIQKENAGKKLGEILIAQKKVPAQEVISGLRDQRRSKRVSNLQVKVDTQKLDNLVDLTGELVISQSMLKQNTQLLSTGDQKLYQNINQLAHIVSSIQKIAMSMRMVPIKSTFQKMVRLVRDLARNSGKEIGLEMFGEETEIDRNVVEALYEPMVHMIRNSADHGIETIEERTKAGKERKGTIQLRAYHKGGNIIIEIEDDGRGLDKERILKKAISSNLVSEDANLTDAEIYDLIMQPGFSTAKEITDVSGRGVGMDVVKKGIEKLRGRLEIRSKAGRGSTFIITLPLTLAIIEGMLVRVGSERFVIPTMAILESFKPRKEEYFTVEGKGELVKVRGKLIPLIRLDRICDVQADSKMPWDGLVVVVENKGEQRGLLLDDLLGKGEFVIKSLGESLKGIKGLAGGAILGDGRVGLILDIAGLFDIAFKYAA